MSRDGGGYWMMWIVWMLPRVLLVAGLVVVGMYLGSRFF